MIAVEHPFSPPTIIAGSLSKADVVRHSSNVMHAKYHFSNAFIKEIPLISCIVSALAVFGKKTITNFAHCRIVAFHGMASLLANCQAIAYTKVGHKLCSISVDSEPSGPAALAFRSLALVSSTSCTVSFGN